LYPQSWSCLYTPSRSGQFPLLAG
jgi:hypothetical protein